MEEEIWKDIPDYEGLYKASSLGNIMSLNYRRTNKNKILTFWVSHQGYALTILTKNKKRKTYSTHSLIASAFLNHVPCGHKLVVNHKDFNKLNNRPDNFEIITQRENTNRKHLTHSSIYTGVSWLKLSKKWQSHIVINKKIKYLGSFDNEIEASMAYQNELSKL